MNEGSQHGRALDLHYELTAIYSPPKGRWGFLAATNHTIVGRRFMLTAIAFFLLGGVFAMLIRAQLAGADTAFLEAGDYAQVFTMHGTVMMFLFAIPLIEGFALYMLPKLLGARDLAFPRLSAFGYWCYLAGGLILIFALIAGAAPDSGWFMYTPLSSRPYSPGINSDIWLVGVTVVEVSAVCAAVEIMVTVLKVRAPGMSLHRMPLLAWYLLVTAAMMLAGFPPLILGSIMLELERAFSLPFFDPTRGGDPLLWQHLFWLFGHPEVYIIFLPAAGVVSTILPVFCRRPIVGHDWIIGALIAQAFLSFGLWVHHMFTTGIPHLSLAFFSAASLLVVIPTAIQIFAWLATLLKGRPEPTLPMIWILGFFFVFVTGGLTGVMVAIVPFDWQVHDTHFVVAHLHYVLVGGFVFPVVAGLYYWTSQFTGRRSDRGLGRLAFWTVFAGFNLTFFVMHWTGLLGMPRRVYTYAEGLGWELPNLVSSIGSFILAFGFALIAIDMLVQWRFAPHVASNPWRAGSLEWAMASPVPAYNFASLPEVSARDPLLADEGLAARLAAGKGYLAGASAPGRRETIGVTVLGGRAEQLIVLPDPSFVPLIAALLLVGFALSFLAGFYRGAALLAAAFVGACLRWLWQTGLRGDPDPVDIGHGQSVPLHPAVRGGPGWWGLVFTLVFDATLIASLLFGYVFLLTIAPNWPPPAFVDPDPTVAAASLAGLGALWLGADRAERANRHGGTGDPAAWLVLCGGGGIASGASLLLVPLLLAPPAAEHAYGAAVLMLSATAILHSTLAAIGAVFVLARLRAGYVSATRAGDLVTLRLFCRFAAGAGAVILLAIYLLPLAVRA
ncbi:cytochrome c oxidase subunit I [Erythrobacter sp. HL-111]|uniref:cytochrome c oxidase subunit I n=1 Tax=Erythrobacter sp. HL-111 TaxID=1798193 RepID=UPI0006DBC34A|nr:cytochrome c oxidase subunit I [Erythrobacter sp. HL-111]KPP88614.1 MAG: cytochrome c oxidase subunits I and III CoxAC [Erythrobacteraceae bacterium HL-111]SDS31780.1 cytochrome c oxidase subunit I+III [Erythrobacter sp. HL-111]